jgi:hypothetical protein
VLFFLLAALVSPLCGQEVQGERHEAASRRPLVDSARRDPASFRADAADNRALLHEAGGQGWPAAVQAGGPPTASDPDWTRNRKDSREVPLGATIVAGSEQHAVAVVVTRIINGSKDPVRNARIHMFTPLDLPHQLVHELEIEGDAATSSDEWGNSLASYQADLLAPGQCLSGRWIAHFSMRRFQWRLKDSVNGSADDLPPAERALYLRDAKHFDIGNSTRPGPRERGTNAATSAKRPARCCCSARAMVPTPR